MAKARAARGRACAARRGAARRGTIRRTRAPDIPLQTSRSFCGATLRVRDAD